jgi:hypothetical protein
MHSAGAVSNATEHYYVLCKSTAGEAIHRGECSSNQQTGRGMRGERQRGCFTVFPGEKHSCLHCLLAAATLLIPCLGEGVEDSE